MFPLHFTRVQYSLIMTAPNGRVNFVCESDTETVCDGSTGGDADADGSVSNLDPGGEMETERPIMVEFDGTDNSNMFMEMQGLSFMNCSRQLRFDNLQRLTVRNCAFM